MVQHPAAARQVLDFFPGAWPLCMPAGTRARQCNANTPTRNYSLFHSCWRFLCMRWRQIWHIFSKVDSGLCARLPCAVLFPFRAASTPRRPGSGALPIIWRFAGVVQWQDLSFPSSRRGFDSHRPLQCFSPCCPVCQPAIQPAGDLPRAEAPLGRGAEGTKKCFCSACGPLRHRPGSSCRCTVYSPFLFQPDGRARTALGVSVFFRVLNCV